MKRLCCLAVVALCLTAVVWGGHLPKEPLYSERSQWSINDRKGEVDLFYIISTETGDYKLADGTVCSHADTYSDSLRLPMRSEMRGVDRLLCGRTEVNFYSPYYRQCSLQSFISDSLTAARLPVAQDDVCRAFAYYLEHYNNGRPFVLAGYSQGAMLMYRLMREMSDDVFSRMVAAYFIGIAIPEDSLADNPRIVPARGADDTGVSICYNSVRDTLCSLWPYHSAVAINPVNWRTDETPATLVTVPSPIRRHLHQQEDTLTVHLDTATGLLLVDGYRGKGYMLPLFDKEGNYHTREIWLYRNQLRENIVRRARKFLKDQ